MNSVKPAVLPNRPQDPYQSTLRKTHKEPFVAKIRQEEREKAFRVMIQPSGNPAAASGLKEHNISASRGGWAEKTVKRRVQKAASVAGPLHQKS